MKMKGLIEWLRNLTFIYAIMIFMTAGNESVASFMIITAAVCEIVRGILCFKSFFEK